MNTIEIMKSRRSVRHFTDKKVPPEHIQQLLEAAMSAPSAYGRRPWHFVVVTEEEVFNQILARPHYSALETAQVGILVCGDLHAEKDEQFLIAGCSTAIENILIAAQSLGLGAVWSSIYPFEKEMLGFQKIFNLPGHILPITFIPVGYPPQKMPVIDRFEEERVHYNRW